MFVKLLKYIVKVAPGKTIIRGFLPRDVVIDFYLISYQLNILEMGVNNKPINALDREIIALFYMSLNGYWSEHC